MERPAAAKKQYGVGDALHIVRCNHCKEPVLWEHRALHSLDCRKRRNAEKLKNLNLTAKDGKPLYAVAVTRRRLGRWRAPEILYAHANDVAEAKRNATAGEGELKIIEAGLAVGWFQHEKTGIITG